MKITYHGHSCFTVETSQSRLVIDPYLTDNSLADVSPADIRCDYVLLTHGHEDHTGDALEIAKANDATVVGNYEIGEYYAALGVKSHGMNPGGAWDFPFGRVKLTIAHHTSSRNAGLNPIYLGEACGIILEADGRRFYDAGDTALFLDMQLIGRNKLDAAMLPIGDNFTMGPEDAIEALDMLKPGVCIPIHYNTWPEITQDAEAFARDAAKRGHSVKPLKAGESIAI